MATVIALESFVGVLEKDVRGEPRIEKHSEFPNQPSVFPGKVIKPGKKIDIIRGQRYEDSHPAVKKWPQMFGLVNQSPIIEQATAAPGEKRGRA